MNTRMIVTESQRRNAYEQALGNFARTIRPAAPAAAPQVSAGDPAQPLNHPPRAMKHAFLAMLHARSNSGVVQIRDVARVFDELTMDQKRAAR
ncbi:MAG: hypothetical protein V2I53_06585 [Paracoccaceae bacterium]|jgi:hypothetical protein|nr:hypothetical protein [Paracoccaceae bacterium]